MFGASRPCVFIFGNCPSLSASTLLPVFRGLLTAESSMLIVGARGRDCCPFEEGVLPSSGTTEDMPLYNRPLALYDNTFLRLPKVPQPLKPQLYPNACSNLISYEGKAEIGRIVLGSTLTGNDPDVIAPSFAMFLHAEVMHSLMVWQPNWRYEIGVCWSKLYVSQQLAQEVRFYPPQLCSESTLCFRHRAQRPSIKSSGKDN